ncbi:MAG: hypothetical protein M3170_07440 [Candidatus Dormibacteraeota bacterium]|nr:hypothetical protein [Candidatus Dormibacteraeota bacterium]
MPKTNAVLPGFWGNVGLAVVFFLLTLTARPTRRRLAWRGLIAAFLLLAAVSVLGLALNYDPTRPPAVRDAGYWVWQITGTGADFAFLLLGIVVMVYLSAVIAGGITRAGREVAETWHSLRRRWESRPPAR